MAEDPLQGGAALGGSVRGAPRGPDRPAAAGGDGADMKHWFLSPSLQDPFYVCGGMQIFHRAHELVSTVRETERITYRHREEGVRYLDDVDPAELEAGLVWVTWQSHVTELAGRLA